jgi:hypothetical protein
MTSVSASSSSGSDSLASSSFAVAALLDSGSSFALLPNDIAQSIFDEVGATEVLGYAVVPCALAQKNGTIIYAFGGPGGITIKVPVGSLITSIPPEANALFGGPPIYPDGQLACILGIEDEAGRGIILPSCVMLTLFTIWSTIASDWLKAISTALLAMSLHSLPWALPFLLQLPQLMKSPPSRVQMPQQIPRLPRQASQPLFQADSLSPTNLFRRL